MDRAKIVCCDEADVIGDDPDCTVEECPFECEFKAHLDAAELRMAREGAGQLRLPLDKSTRSRVILPSEQQEHLPHRDLTRSNRVFAG